MLNTIEQQRDIWRQLALLDDYARGRNGQYRSEQPDSPLGQGVWISETARQSNSRSGDLAEGWCRLAEMRHRRLQAGDSEADFVAEALSHPVLGRLFGFILREYWGYSMAG